jgi:mRNA-degrading endonuclease RelE of RelBE toxin-antitoxin system
MSLEIQINKKFLKDLSHVPETQRKKNRSFSIS